MTKKTEYDSWHHFHLPTQRRGIARAHVGCGGGGGASKSLHKQNLFPEMTPQSPSAVWLPQICRCRAIGEGRVSRNDDSSNSSNRSWRAERERAHLRGDVPVARPARCSKWLGTPTLTLPALQHTYASVCMESSRTLLKFFKMCINLYLVMFRFDPKMDIGWMTNAVDKHQFTTL